MSRHRSAGGCGRVLLAQCRADPLRVGAQLDDLRDLTAALARCRRSFDLDADPIAVSTQLQDRELIGELVRAHPGVRIPGAVDGFELAIRTVIRENNDPELARDATATLVRRHGRAVRTTSPGVTHCFPSPETLAEADPATFAVDPTRAMAISALATKVAAGEIRLDAGADLEESIGNFLVVPGIGPWIASYVAMRALGDPDAFLHGCARIERGLTRLGVAPTTATVSALSEQWRPWRSYAVAQPWRSLDDEANTLSRPSELAETADVAALHAAARTQPSASADRERVLSPSPFLSAQSQIARAHHERLDGSGYQPRRHPAGACPLGRGCSLPPTPTPR